MRYNLYILATSIVHHSNPPHEALVAFSNSVVKMRCMMDSLSECEEK